MLYTKDESLLRMRSICAAVADLTVAGVATDVACRGLFLHAVRETQSENHTILHGPPPKAFLHSQGTFIGVWDGIEVSLFYPSLSGSAIDVFARSL